MLDRRIFRGMTLGLLLSLVTFTVFAWAVLTLVATSHGTASATSAGAAPNIGVLLNDCQKTGTGVLTCVLNGSKGVDISITGISNNLAGGTPTIVTASLMLHNNGAKNVTGVWTSHDDTGCTITHDGMNAITAGGNEGGTVIVNCGAILPSGTSSVSIDTVWQEVP